MGRWSYSYGEAASFGEWNTNATLWDKAFLKNKIKMRSCVEDCFHCSDFCRTLRTCIGVQETKHAHMRPL